MSEEDILAIADLPPLENPTIAFLQEILCKMSLLRFLTWLMVSNPCLPLSSEIPSSSLFSLPLSHGQQWNFSVLCLYFHRLNRSNSDPILHIGASMIATATTEEAMLLGFAYGRLAIRIIETHIVAPEVACPVYSFFASHVLVWHRPLVDTQRYFLAAISKGLETYDTLSTGIAVIDRAVVSFFAGESLDLVQAKLEEAVPLVKRATRKHWLAMPAKVVYHLRGMEVKEELGDSPEFDPEMALLKAQEYQAHTHLFRHHFYQMLLAAFTGQTTVGISHAKACEIYHISAGGSFFSGMYVFYSAMLYLDNQDNLVQSEQALLRQKMDLLLLWSKTSPSTFEHKYKLLRTMQVSNELDTLTILDAFDDAIFRALENGMLHDAALFAERCSRWLTKSSPNRSWQYQDFARRQYEFWGASAKVKELSDLIAIRRASARIRGFRIPKSYLGTDASYPAESKPKRRIKGSLLAEAHFRRPYRQLFSASVPPPLDAGEQL
jgi:hypothetical protein